MPISLFVLVLLIWLVKADASVIANYSGGVVMTAAGMALFLIGARLGLLPMGQAIGTSLPQRSSLLFVVVVTFFISFVVTLSEPNIMVLATQAEELSGGSIGSGILIFVIAIGSGFMVTLALLRVIFGVSIRLVLAIGYALVVVLSFFTPASFVPLAFDAGAFSTGLMTIPVTMSLGVGFASVLSRRRDVADTFGFIGLSCLGPVVGVMVMGIILL